MNLNKNNKRFINRDTFDKHLSFHDTVESVKISHYAKLNLSIYSYVLVQYILFRGKIRRFVVIEFVKLSDLEQSPKDSHSRSVQNFSYLFIGILLRLNTFYCKFVAGHSRLARNCGQTSKSRLSSVPRTTDS